MDTALDPTEGSRSSGPSRIRLVSALVILAFGWWVWRYTLGYIDAVPPIDNETGRWALKLAVFLLPHYAWMSALYLGTRPNGGGDGPTPWVRLVRRCAVVFAVAAFVMLGALALIELIVTSRSST